jgi:hypothetical protein
LSWQIRNRQAVRVDNAGHPGHLQGMERMIHPRATAPAVTLVATPDRILHLGSTGQADVAGDRPIRPDSIFWIASMTKPIIATAMLMLQDEDKSVRTIAGMMTAAGYSQSAV